MKKNIILMFILTLFSVSGIGQKITSESIQITRLKNSQVLATDDRGNIVRGGLSFSEFTPYVGADKNVDLGKMSLLSEGVVTGLLKLKKIDFNPFHSVFESKGGTLYYDGETLKYRDGDNDKKGIWRTLVTIQMMSDVSSTLVDRGGYVGTAQSLKDEIDALKKGHRIGFYRKYSGSNEIAGYVVFKIKITDKDEVFRLHLNNFKDGDGSLGFFNSIIKVENGVVVDAKSISTDFIGLPQVNYYIQDGVLTIGVSPSGDVSVNGVLGSLESLIKPLEEYEMAVTTFENESEYEQKGGDGFYDRIGGDFINYTSKHLVTKDYVDKGRELEEIIIEGGKVVGVKKHINIPEGVTEIVREAFHLGTPGGWQITNVTLPSSLTKIGERAFLNNRIREITIPSSVALIERTAFGGNNLTKVTLPPNCHYKTDSFDLNVTVTGGIKDN